MNINNKPLVSVIIPTYNRAHIIGRAIRSIFSQGYSNLEVIVVDDASNDNTEEVVNDFKNDKIFYTRLSINSGASAARNKGINLAKGDLIAFLDSDDEWLSDMINQQLAIFKANPNTDASFTAFIRYYGNNPAYISPNLSKSKTMMESILLNNFITAQTLMLKSACIKDLGGFDVTLSHREDWDFGVRLLSSKQVEYIDLPLAIVYETPGNLSSMTEDKVSTLEQFIKKHYQLLKKHPAIISQHYYYLGHNYILLGNKSVGVKYFFNSMLAKPNIKSIIGLSLSFIGCNFYRFVRSAL